MRYQCRANYEVINENKDSVIIKDIGPWDKYQTITNNAEGVVEELSYNNNRLLSPLGNRHIYYIDSSGVTDELLHRNGRFVGFKTTHNHQW